MAWIFLLEIVHLQLTDSQHWTGGDYKDGEREKNILVVMNSELFDDIDCSPCMPGVHVHLSVYSLYGLYKESRDSPQSEVILSTVKSWQ